MEIWGKKRKKKLVCENRMNGNKTSKLQALLVRENEKTLIIVIKVAKIMNTITTPDQISTSRRLQAKTKRFISRQMMSNEASPPTPLSVVARFQNREKTQSTIPRAIIFSGS